MMNDNRMGGDHTTTFFLYEKNEMQRSAGGSTSLGGNVTSVSIAFEISEATALATKKVDVCI